MRDAVFTQKRAAYLQRQITFTLPAETLNGASLALVSPDGTETPLSLNEENGTVSFTLTFTDMALLRLIFEA